MRLLPRIKARRYRARPLLLHMGYALMIVFKSTAHADFTPVHLVESVENYALCMRRCLLRKSNISVTYSALAFTRANRADASAKH